MGLERHEEEIVTLCDPNADSAKAAEAVRKLANQSYLATGGLCVMGYEDISELPGQPDTAALQEVAATKRTKIEPTYNL